MVGNPRSPGIVSMNTTKLLHIIGSLLSPVREKYRQISVYEEWVDYKRENGFECDQFIKEKTSRKV